MLTQARAKTLKGRKSVSDGHTARVHEQNSYPADLLNRIHLVRDGFTPSNGRHQDRSKTTVLQTRCAPNLTVLDMIMVRVGVDREIDEAIGGEPTDLVRPNSVRQVPDTGCREKRSGVAILLVPVVPPPPHSLARKLSDRLGRGRDFPSLESSGAIR